MNIFFSLLFSLYEWEFLSKEERETDHLGKDELEKICNLPDCFHRETKYFTLLQSVFTQLLSVS